MGDADTRDGPGHREDEDTPLEAGEFSSWLAQMRAAIRGAGEADVPCGGCTACCTSSQFVHIEPDETDTLAHIPAELLFPAPRLPNGHMLLGYDERGHCPMLVGNRCSIYEHRPRTCRTYDCRVFPAASVDLDDPEKTGISRRARRWRFTHSTPADRVEHEAVRAAARFLDEHRRDLPDPAARASATQRAVLAVEVHDLFLHRDSAGGDMTIVEPDVADVRAEITRRSR